jgi:hypothetical protein
MILNRYISKYLNTEEPFPPTVEFIESVRKDIFPEQLPNYSPTISESVGITKFYGRSLWFESKSRAKKLALLLIE